MPSDKNEISELFGELKLTDDGCWYAVYTKSRHEKKVAKSCIDYNISYYLPLIESVRYYHNRAITFRKPLFSSYIFCNCNHTKKTQLYRTGQLCAFIEAPDQEQLLAELKQIHYAQNEGAKLIPHKFLTRGRRVKIIRGPFKNYEGKISYRKGAFKLVLNIDLIKQAVAIEVNAKNIALLDE